MKNTILFILFVAFLGSQDTVQAQKSMYFSPIPAVGVGPSGPSSSKIKVEPARSPSTALAVTSPTGAKDNEFQWVHIPLDLPAGATISGIEVCYEIDGNPKLTYISQTRITSMTTPNSASVKLDDPTDQRSSSATCYSVRANATVKGSMSLAFRVAIGKGETLKIGSILVRL